MLWLNYARRGLIEDRPNLKSGWEIWMPELKLSIGHVESYWDPKQNHAVLWRTMDHQHADFRKGYATRELAAQELATHCPRTVALISARRARMSLATGAAAG